MNILFMPTTQMLAITEGAGGLFDFNATLPLMAIQFVLLTVALTFIFYKPVSKVLDDRELYISGNLTQASEKLIKADELYKQYDEQLKTAKVNAQATIAKAEKERIIIFSFVTAGIEGKASSIKKDVPKKKITHYEYFNK